MKTDKRAFEAYRTGGFTLIPLHHHADETTDKKGVVRKNGKRPIHPNWTRREYSTEAVIKEAGQSNRNLGVRLTSSQLAIDVDPRNGGNEGFTDLCLSIGLDPSIFPHVITGSGGSHYYLSKPDDILIRDTLKDFKGVEFKSKGRQVVAAGSIHPDTKQFYRWNEDAPPLSEIPAAPSELLDLIKRPEHSKDVTPGGQYTPEQLARALEALPPEDFRKHDDWLQFMMACHHATQGEARREYIEWSTSDPMYKDHAEVIGRRWDSLHSDKMDGITYRTLNHYLQKYGASNLQAPNEIGNDFDDEVDLPADASTEVIRVEQRGLTINRQNKAPDTIANSFCAVANLDIRFNLLSQTVEFGAETLPWAETFGRVLTDHTLRLLRLFLIRKHQGVGFEPSRENLYEAVMTIAYAKKFDPVLEYLRSLKWDGKRRVEQLFSRYFGCADDEYTRAVSRCFMVGAVRRVRQPGCKFDTVPVLKGKQGIGKSTGVKTLFGADYHSDSDLGNLRDRDAAMKLRGLWVHEFSEFDSLSRSETSVLKAFLSSATDRQRDPYGRIVENHPRRNVHFATVNEGGYLKDGTGGRRFWPLHATRPIDLSALAEHRDQLWAEAAVLEARGEPDTLPPELWAVAGERQARETSDDPWVDSLRIFLEERAWTFTTFVTGDEEDQGPPLPPDRVHSSELFEAINIPVEARTKDKAQRLRTVMEAGLKWQHRRGVRVGSVVQAGYVRKG